MTDLPVTLEDEFGDIIQKARQGKGLTLEQLGETAQLPLSLLSEIESYQALPTTEQLHRLAVSLGLNETKLSKIAAESWKPREITFNLGTLRLFPLWGDKGQSHCYIVTDQNIESCVIVDPGVSRERLSSFIESHQLTLEACLITHNHQDHISALPVLEEQGVLVYSGAADNISTQSVTVLEESKLHLLKQEWEVLSTPGHTGNSLSFLVGPYAFVGDLLFAGSLGRSGRAEWYDSHLKSAKRILALPRETLILPGHGVPTTVADELQGNPFF